MFVYNIRHLTFCAPQTVIRACVFAKVYLAVHLLQRQKYFRVANLRSIQLITNPEPSPGIHIVFYRERNNRRICFLPEPNNQIFFHQLFLKAMNMVGASQCLLGYRSETVSKHFNLDIKTM